MELLLEDYIENVETDELIDADSKVDPNAVKLSIDNWYTLAYEMGCEYILTVYVSQIQAMSTLRGWIKQTVHVLDVLGIEHTYPQILGNYYLDLPVIENLKEAPDIDFKPLAEDPVIDQIGVHDLYMAIKVGILGLDDSEAGLKMLLKILTYMPYDGYGRNTVHINRRRPAGRTSRRKIEYMRHDSNFVACDRWRFLSLIVQYKKAHKEIDMDYLNRSKAPNKITDEIIESDIFYNIKKERIYRIVDKYLRFLINS